MQGYPDPVRPVIQLVAELEEGLLQPEEVEQCGGLGGVARQEARGAFAIGLEELGRHPASPDPRPGVEPLEGVGVDLAGVVQGAIGRVIERAKHPGHILERRLLGPTLFQGPARLPFEVEDEEVVLLPEELAEVVVAVDPDLDQAIPLRRPVRDHFQEPRAGGQNFLGQLPDVIGEGFELALERGEACQKVPLQVVGSGPASSLDGQRLGSEGRVVGVAGERQVHLGGPPAEDPGGQQARPDHLVDVAG